MKLKQRLTKVLAAQMALTLVAGQVAYGTEIKNQAESLSEVVNIESVQTQEEPQDIQGTEEESTKEENEVPEDVKDETGEKPQDAIIENTEGKIEDGEVEEGIEDEVTKNTETDIEESVQNEVIENTEGEVVEDVTTEATNPEINIDNTLEEIVNEENIEEALSEAIAEINQDIQGANYADGMYIGEGKGYHASTKIKLQVTIFEGQITYVEVLEQEETASFWERCKVLIDYIQNMGNPSTSDIEAIEVDVVTGASEDSKTCLGIQEAMIEALSKAAISDDIIFASGDGTEDSPYVIGNKYQLNNFSKSVATGESYEGQYIELLDDIDISAIEWVPIGNIDVPFKGHFNGNGHSIIGMTITNNVNLEQIGFFGKLGEGATVSEVVIYDANIDIISEVGSRTYLGSLAGYTDENVVINNCKVQESSMRLEATNEQFIYVGGLVGSLGENAAITNCMVEVNTQGVSGNTCYVGGLAGMTNNKALVMNNLTSGEGRAEVMSSSKNNAKAVVGGIVGMGASTIYNCYADYNVEAMNANNADNVQVAGNVAWCTKNGTVLNCLYNSNGEDGVIIFPEGTTMTYQITDVSGQTCEEIKGLLNKNLAPSNIEAAKSVLAENENTAGRDFGFNENNHTFYSWELTGDTVSLTEKVWRPEFNPSEIFEGGTGTKEDPYRVQTEEQLRRFAVSLSDTHTYNGDYIILTNDIQLSDEFFTPIGEGEYVFDGTFDGQGYEISGMRIKGENDSQYILKDGEVYFGLFGVIGKKGTVKNLGVVDVDINVCGKYTTVVGGITGLIDGGIVDSCYVTGSLKGQTTDAGNNYAGGIAGWSVKGYVVNSYSDVTVYSSVLPTALSMAGGLVGMTNRTIVANCYSLGTSMGHTERKLEVVESMAAVGGLTGVAGSPVVNCYTTSNTISEDYSYYVGATAGWATGIAELYNLYYLQDAVQEIKGESISPIAGIGWFVGPGINDEGELYGGTLKAEVVGKKQEEMQNLAAQLNSNFDAFPLSYEALPESIQLKKWIVKDGVVTFSDKYATRTYKAPDVETPDLTGNYWNGTFYGRDFYTSDYIKVKLEVENKRIKSIISDTEIEGMEEIIKEVISSQEGPTIYETDSEAVVSFKSAIKVAIKRALTGDYTDYNYVDATIFAGGEGTVENPYQIATADQLVKFAASVNEVENFKEKYICLTKDIDLQGINFVPAGGNGLYAFSGTFDGNGFKIKNMHIGTKEIGANYISVGLFAHLDEATIKNLGITDAFIHNDQVTIASLKQSKIYVGLIAGYAGKISTKGSRGVVIDNCYGEGHIMAKTGEHNYVGGLVGSLVHSAITNSYADCVIEATSPSNWVYAGGLVGLPAFSVLANNYAYGEINSETVVNKSQIGGIAGMHSSYSINNYVDVRLHASNQTVNMGALAGTNSGIAYIEKCYGNAKVTQQAGDKINAEAFGSIVNGENHGKGQISECVLKESADSTLIEALNTNKVAVLEQEWCKKLIENWAIYMPNEMTFKSWTLDDGKVAFAKDVQENNQGSNGGNNNGGSSNTSSGSNNSSNSGGSGSSNSSGVINAGQNKEPETVPENSTASTNPFTDVKAHHWYYDAVQFVQNHELMKGVKENVFAPNAKATRGMFITILHNNEGNPSVSEAHGFKDVKAGDWYSDAIAWGRANQIVAGTSLNTFSPKSNVTREQLVVLMYNYAKFKNYDLAGTADLSQFKDSPSVWAEEAMKWAVENGIVNGKGQDILDPKGECTRAEMAQIIMNFFQKYIG